MNTVTTQVYLNTETVKLINLVKNLETRWFFFHKEGRTPQQHNRLNRAYNALYAMNMDIAYEAWQAAYHNTDRQVPETVEFIEPNTSPTGFTANYFRKGYVQPELSEINDLDAAFEDGEYNKNLNFDNMLPYFKKLHAKEKASPKEEEIYDGTDVLTSMKEDDELLGWQLSVTFDQHCEEMVNLFNSQAAKPRLDKIDNLSRELATITGQSSGFMRDTYRVRQGLERLRHNGYQLKMDTPDLIKRIAEAIQWFESFSDSIDDPTELDQLRDSTREVALIELTPASPPQDRSFQIRHNGWQMTRKATYGVGTLAPIQQLFQMGPRVFYSMLALRDTRFPRVSIGEIANVTRYKVNDEGKRRVLPHTPEVDDLIRMVCMAQWHDDVHHTNYRVQIENWLESEYPQELVQSVLEIAHLALVQEPTSMNRFWKRLYWKEMNQMKARRYGPYHSAAQ